MGDEKVGSGQGVSDRHGTTWAILCCFNYLINSSLGRSEVFWAVSAPEGMNREDQDGSGCILKLHRDLWTQAYWTDICTFPDLDPLPFQREMKVWMRWDKGFNNVIFVFQMQLLPVSCSDEVCAVPIVLNAGSSLKFVFLLLCTWFIIEKWWNHFHFLVNNKKSHCDYLLILSGLCLRNNAFLCNSSYLGVLLVPRFCPVRPWDALQLVAFSSSILFSRATG